MADKDKALASCLGALLILIVGVPVSTLLYGWALSLLWSWFISPIHVAQETEKLFAVLKDSSKSPSAAVVWRDAWCHEYGDDRPEGQETKLTTAQQFAEYLAEKGWHRRGLNLYCGGCD